MTTAGKLTLALALCTTHLALGHVVENANQIKYRMVKKEFEGCSKYGAEKKEIDATTSDFSEYLKNNANRSSANHTTYAFLLALRSRCEPDSNKALKEESLKASYDNLEKALKLDIKNGDKPNSEAVGLIAKFVDGIIKKKNSLSNYDPRRLGFNKFITGTLSRFNPLLRGYFQLPLEVRKSHPAFATIQSANKALVADNFATLGS